MIGAIILLIVLIALNAIFASAEIAVLSMSEAKKKKLVEQKDKRALKLEFLTEQPARFLATIQVAITLAGLLSSAYAADYFAEPLVNALVNTGIGISKNVLQTAAVFIITLILAYFNLVLGELVPKRIAMKKADSIALGMAGLLYSVAKIFAPLVALLTGSTNLILKLFGMDGQETEDQVTEEEILMLLEAGGEQGVIDEQESEIIQNVFEFGDLSAEQICTHRLDVSALEESDSDEKWEQIIFEEKHTYYPVYQETKDNIIGILDTREYFALRHAGRDQVLKQALKPVYFVPKEIKADMLFQNMRRERKYFAVLLDEYGGMSGIITVHDLIEAIVGDVYDGPEEEASKPILQTGENTWIITGEAELSDMEKELNVELPTGEYDTFNGLVYNIVGGVPEDGTSLECTGYGLKIQVQEVKKHRIERAVVEVMH
ncbi:MAG: HlyC/CorC family transporter [Lachnospiraceae bacterium]|nr:HlyC/CorC family transporter [Lachnospiraceae bacterium]